MIFKSKNTKAIDEVVMQSANFEISMSNALEKSERRAWLVAFCAVTLAILLAVGYIFVMPLKEQVPYLVLADPYRGTSTVAKLDDYGNSALSTSEAINKSNVAHFVIARESYDWELLSRRDRRVVYSMATDSALSEYKALYEANNPQNPDVMYGQNASIRVKILNIILSGGDPKGEKPTPPTGATVRFERWLFDRTTGDSKLLDTQIASMKITYQGNLKMSEDARVENPLGFRINAYRVDQDAIGAATSATLPTQVAPVASAPEQAQTPALSVTPATSIGGQ